MQIAEIVKLDGRKKAPRPILWPLLPNMSDPTVGTVRRFIEILERDRGSSHSSIGMLLPYGLAYAREMGYDYTLTCTHGRYWLQLEGYVERT